MVFVPLKKKKNYFVKPEMNLRFSRRINVADLKLTAIRRKTLEVHSPLKSSLMMSKKFFIDSKKSNRVPIKRVSPE